MWKDTFKKRLGLLDAPIFYIDKETLTPIDYDEYNK